MARISIPKRFPFTLTLLFVQKINAQYQSQMNNYYNKLHSVCICILVPSREFRKTILILMYTTKYILPLKSTHSMHLPSQYSLCCVWRHPSSCFLFFIPHVPTHIDFEKKICQTEGHQNQRTDLHLHFTHVRWSTTRLSMSRPQSSHCPC